MAQPTKIVNNLLPRFWGFFFFLSLFLHVQESQRQASSTESRIWKRELQTLKTKREEIDMSAKENVTFQVFPLLPFCRICSFVLDLHVGNVVTPSSLRCKSVTFVPRNCHRGTEMPPSFISSFWRTAMQVLCIVS